MSLRYLILIMFGMAICSRSSAQSCSRCYFGGQWISEVDCGGPEMMSNVMRELEERAKDEKMKPTENPTAKPTEKHTKNPTEKPTATPTEKPTENPTENPTVFQRRIKGDVDFYRNWTEYVIGFGSPEGDYWLGLDNLHEMTKDGNMELEINMIKKNGGTHMVAKYSVFSIGPGSDKYRLNISGYSGNATGDALSYYNYQFSTKDEDHDSTGTNCASEFGAGGWWYSGCGNSNLNGIFNGTGHKGIWWWSYFSDLLSFSEMKLWRKS